MYEDYVFILEDVAGLSVWSTLDRAKEEAALTLENDYNFFEELGYTKPDEWGSYFINEKYDYLMERGGADFVSITPYKVDASHPFNHEED